MALDDALAWPEVMSCLSLMGDLLGGDKDARTLFLFGGLDTREKSLADEDGIQNGIKQCVQEIACQFAVEAKPTASRHPVAVCEAKGEAAHDAQRGQGWPGPLI